MNVCRCLRLRSSHLYLACAFTPRGPHALLSATPSRHFRHPPITQDDDRLGPFSLRHDRKFPFFRVSTPSSSRPSASLAVGFFRRCGFRVHQPLRASLRALLRCTHGQSLIETRALRSIDDFRCDNDGAAF